MRKDKDPELRIHYLAGVPGSILLNFEKGSSSLPVIPPGDEALLTFRIDAKAEVRGIAQLTVPTAELLVNVYYEGDDSKTHETEFLLSSTETAGELAVVDVVLKTN